MTTPTVTELQKQIRELQKENESLIADVQNTKTLAEMRANSIRKYKQRVNLLENSVLELAIIIGNETSNTERNSK